MLKIIISPAKKMNRADDDAIDFTMPLFLEQTETLKEYLQSQDYQALKEIWNCNDKITTQNWERLQDMDLKSGLTPAVLAYEGIQYQSMAPRVFEKSALEYIEKHLYILSGFYGILRAFDGVTPYRLEMQARLRWESGGEKVTSLYDYWGDRLYRTLVEAKGDDVSQTTIINLASKEYSKAIEPWVEPKVKLVNCVFGELVEDKGSKRVRVKATAAKIARGAMVRYMAEKQIQQVEQLKKFNLLGYHYEGDLSDQENLTFCVDKPAKFR